MFAQGQPEQSCALHYQLVQGGVLHPIRNKTTVSCKMSTRAAASIPTMAPPVIFDPWNALTHTVWVPLPVLGDPVPIDAFGLQPLYVGLFQPLKPKMPPQIAEGVGGGGHSPLSTILPCCLQSQGLRQRPN